MNNYAESKKALDRIRNEYGCKGEVLFRTAIQTVVEYGTSDLLDDYIYEHLKYDINERHNSREAEGKIPVVSRRWELAVLECAREIAQVDAHDFLMYIQREVWLGGDGLDYQRVVELLHSCMNWFVDYDCCESSEMRHRFNDLGFDDVELEELGFTWLFDTEEEN